MATDHAPQTLQYSYPLKRGAKWSPCSACPAGSPVPCCHFCAGDMSVTECTFSLTQVHAKPLVPSIEPALLCYGHFLASVKVSIYLLSFPCSVLFNFYLSLTNVYTLYSYRAHEKPELSDFPQQGVVPGLLASPKSLSLTTVHGTSYIADQQGEVSRDLLLLRPQTQLLPVSPGETPTAPFYLLTCKTWPALP